MGEEKSEEKKENKDETIDKDKKTRDLEKERPIWKAVAMSDHFKGNQKLPDPVPGCPNFRRVPGYKIYCCGQPTVAGFEEALKKVTGDFYPKDGKILWINMRQESTIYVNGEPYCARPSNKIGEYAELGNVTRDSVKAEELEFLKTCQERISSNDGKLKFFDVEKKESEVEAKDIAALTDVIEGLKKNYPGLHHMRVPICNSASPLEADFDIITKLLVGTPINTPVIVSDQVGLSRATTGCVISCLFREFQISASFDGLIHTVPGVNAEILKMDNYMFDSKKDTLFRGEFDVIKELMEKLKGADAGKKECDKVIDKNGTKKTGGTGIKQIRENIAESKLSYEIMDDSAQVFLKTKIMDNIHKYFYLIVFATYMREAADAAKDATSEDKKVENTLTSGKCAIPATELKVQKTFAQFMEEHKELREMVEKGKGNLQWERDIPAENLDRLKDLAAEDFYGNLGRIVHDLYQTAHVMFSDMPQGDHKKRAKYRFASKTFLRLLPADQRKKVEELIEKKTISLDLYDVLGFCTWGRSKPAEPEAPKEEVKA